MKVSRSPDQGTQFGTRSAMIGRRGVSVRLKEHQYSVRSMALVVTSLDTMPNRARFLSVSIGVLSALILTGAARRGVAQRDQSAQHSLRLHRRSAVGHDPGARQPRDSNAEPRPAGRMRIPLP